MGSNELDQYDLSNIIQVNYNHNFDLLKTILEALLKRQKETSQSISDLHSLNKAKDEKITNLEKDVINLTILIQESLGNSDKLQALKEKQLELDKQPKPSSESNPLSDRDPDKSKISDVRGVDDSLKLNVSVANDEITNKIIKKINAIEQTVNNVATVLSEVTKFKKPIQEHTDQLRQHDNILIEINNRMNTLKGKVDEHEKKLQDILVKMEDFNVLDILKANAGEGGDSSVTLSLISNLEKKLNQKIKFIDERSGKQDEELFKIRSDLNNLKNAHDQTVRNVSGTKDHLEKVDKEIADIYAKMTQLDNDLNNLIEKGFEDMKKMMDDKIKGTMTSLDDKLSDLNDKIANNSLSKPVDDSASNANVNANEINRAIKELTKHLNELERQVKMIPVQINIEAVWKEINAMKESIEQKASIAEHQELRDIVTEIQKQLSLLKDQLETVLEDQSKFDEIQQMKKKMESMNNAIHSLRPLDHDMNNNTSSFTKMQIDTSKFLEIVVFNEFKSSVIKEFENVNENMNQLKRLIDELINAMKSKTSYKDLKALEDDLLAKIEDLKLASNKKFADKIETAKNMKYLDQQIKHIIEVYIKKMEKGDSWLLAKKPLGGHLCASCESYIGDLKDNPPNQHVSWNKYPMRDPNDKLYRIGNGFSKMLQMITVDTPGNPRDINFQTSQEFYTQPYQETHDNRDGSVPKNNSQRGGNLPKINNKKPKLNVSNDDIMNNMEEDGEETDPNQPKITRIYKKNRKTES